nr:competence protein CoiA family protein [Propionicimonas sp.]
MPLTATGPDGHNLDATDCPDDIWAEIYRRRPRVELHCRSCGAPMHAKVSSAGSRFFAHDSLDPTCPSLGETPEHRELKRRIAQALRGLSCHALLEAIPSTGDHGGWRADVLGVSPNGRRVAFEVQLAPMTVDEGIERTARYERDGIPCVWLSPRQAHWIGSLPSCHLTEDDGQLVIYRGLGRLDASGANRWIASGPVTFEKLALGMLSDRITTASQVGLLETVGERVIYTPNATLLVATRDVELLAEAQTAEARRQAEQARRREEEVRRQAEHATNLTALYQRQERVLQHAIDDAAVTLEPGCIWLGIPPTAWDGALPVKRMLARGSDKTRGGAAIWATDPSGDRRLWAVVCPITSKTTPSLGWSWKRRGVRVYTETRKEAERLAAALEWHPDDLLARTSEAALAASS